MSNEQLCGFINQIIIVISKITTRNHFTEVSLWGHTELDTIEVT